MNYKTSISFRQKFLKTLVCCFIASGCLFSQSKENLLAGFALERNLLPIDYVFPHRSDQDRYDDLIREKENFAVRFKLTNLGFRNFGYTLSLVYQRTKYNLNLSDDAVEFAPGIPHYYGFGNQSQPVFRAVRNEIFLNAGGGYTHWAKIKYKPRFLFYIPLSVGVGLPLNNFDLTLLSDSTVRRVDLNRGKEYAEGIRFTTGIVPEIHWFPWGKGSLEDMGICMSGGVQLVYQKNAYRMPFTMYVLSVGLNGKFRRR